MDEPSCSTPRKRSFNLPSIASIEELRTPAFEELLRSFWDGRSAKQQANGDLKHIAAAYEAAQSIRDSRVPLTAINWRGGNQRFRGQRNTCVHNMYGVYMYSCSHCATLPYSFIVSGDGGWKMIVDGKIYIVGFLGELQNLSSLNFPLCNELLLDYWWGLTECFGLSAFEASSLQPSSIYTQKDASRRLILFV